MMYMHVSQNLNYIIFLGEELGFQSTETHSCLAIGYIWACRKLLCSYSDGSGTETPKYSIIRNKHLIAREEF